ncbi:MAG TPA: HAD hydrolase family protein [Gemmatimonadales bacterium]|nr:HAD hydrolase family protein [Gemmatimonadales bacterium]
MGTATRGRSVAPAQATGDPSASADAAFYSHYDWCLNPLLPWDQQLHWLDRELERAVRLPSGWQQQECALNAYLLACGVACTVDDYLGGGVPELTALAERFPRRRRAIAALGALLGLSRAARTAIRDRSLRRWRARWARCVDQASELVLGGPERGPDAWRDIRARCAALGRAPLPRALREQRLRVPEGFRCQDLAHQDVVTLAQRFAERHPDRGRPVVVLGVRTAGAYFAPLTAAYLSLLGWASATWLTVRPRQGLGWPTRRRLRQLGRSGTQVVVVDDHPNTGGTLMLLLRALARCGVSPECIAILTPRHAVKPDWALPPEAPDADRVSVITLEPEETHKARLLTPAALASLLEPWFQAHGWHRVAVRASPQVDAVNAWLAEHGQDAFQVRLQRVFEVELARDDEDPVVRHVVAKSVGWGWLGYHAYLAGTRLAGWVPPVIGLRHGLLFSEWVGPLSPAPRGAPPTVRASTLARYVAHRTQRLGLADGAWLDHGHAAWDGGKLLLGVLRRAYGRYFGRVKAAALRRALRRFASPQPMLVDGRMRPDEWLEAGDTCYKLDYEHHNFGPAELNNVDPAYDLASAIFEFRLDARAEADLLTCYAHETHDVSIADRLLLYKLLVGAAAIDQATSRVPHARNDRHRRYWTERYLAGRTFLAFQVQQVCAGLVPKPPAPSWSGPLVFLDLDGVFDSEVLGFPHTTPSGVAALARLRAHGCAVVLNTGRSVEHVHRYCSIFGLPGGVAEYGSVLVDAVAGREVALASREALVQLEQCRAALGGLAGVCVDAGYRYAIRAYRHAGGRTVGLAPSEVRELVAGCAGVACIATSADTYIVPQGITKGTGLAAVRRYVGRLDTPVAAIGHSDEDVSMLVAADAWYAPANCSERIRALARSGRGRVMARPNQQGLLAAARALVRRWGLASSDAPDLRRPRVVRTAADLVVTVLRAAERRWPARVAAAVAWHRL